MTGYATSGHEMTETTIREPTDRRVGVTEADGSARSAPRARSLTASFTPREVEGGVPGRRTVTIRGRGAERDLMWPAHQSRRRPDFPVYERPGFKPDRMAMWAVFLGLLMVLVAAASSHAAVLAHLPH